MSTKTGQVVALAVSWPVADEREGIQFAVLLRAKIVKDFGPPTHDDRERGWPLVSWWETIPYMAGIVGEGNAVMAMFLIPENEALLKAEGGYNSHPHALY